MTDKYQNKYRIASARAPWWDYGRHAAYFVTICTKHMQHYFGHIHDGVMHLSKIGKSDPHLAAWPIVITARNCVA